MSSVPAVDPAPLSREPICSFGRWLFVPDRRNAAGDVRIGYLTCNGERVVLAHCSRLLADLLQTIRQLEQDFTARCGVDQPTRA